MPKTIEKILPDGTKQVEQFTPDPAFHTALREAGVPGLLALILVGSLGFVVIYGTASHTEIRLPSFLTEAITLVLGFYFGRQSGKSG